jgi:hypothetical protein
LSHHHLGLKQNNCVLWPDNLALPPNNCVLGHDLRGGFISNRELSEPNNVLRQDNRELSQSLFELEQNPFALAPGRAGKGRVLWAAEGRTSRVIRVSNAPPTHVFLTLA